MHAVTNCFSALTLTLSVAALAACTGQVDGSSPMTQPIPGGGGSATSSGGGTTGVGGGTLPPQTCKVASTRAPMRRLSRFEYNNTARDLLKDTSYPANALPSEEL